MSAAGLSDLSQGRFVLGLGVGTGPRWKEATAYAFAVPWPT